MGAEGRKDRICGRVAAVGNRALLSAHHLCAVEIVTGQRVRLAPVGDCLRVRIKVVNQRSGRCVRVGGQRIRVSHSWNRGVQVVAKLAGSCAHNVVF